MTGCTEPGAVAMPAMAVITTSDITRGLSSAKKSRASPVEVSAAPSVRVSKAADIGFVVSVLGSAAARLESSAAGAARLRNAAWGARGGGGDGPGGARRRVFSDPNR